ncbi:hypothetical protein JV173_02680 [Acholeplasma equirhinis]|uniref:hypothetical protein n=1 Tax=Acholeplasma equirhinis TaxID=555393 RepID=UPI00197ABE5E|nr:hypothetical protein [Acholeplasma equirhinis]MBN3490414.1 hypothetical protein [Acholeplasma equirhinis]
MKLLLIITDKGRTSSMLKSCQELNLLTAVTFIGKGTAPTEILDALSLAENDKDVVFALANNEDVSPILNHLEEEFEFTKRGMGVACAMSLNSISSAALKMLNDQLKGEN